MKIGILKTGDVNPALVEKHGEYPDMFIRLRGEVDPSLEFLVVDVDGGEALGEPGDADGWLVTGSRYGAYEDLPWIPPLEALIREIRAAMRPLAGICFGHQIIAQALGGRVVKWPGGWSIGHQGYSYRGREITLNAWHQDQVADLPEGAEVIGHSPFCAAAALRYDAPIWTVQPHPEFGRPAVAALLQHRAQGVVEPERITRAEACLDETTDRQFILEEMATFFRDNAVG